jgi:hypothetical protein
MKSGIGLAVVMVLTATVVARAETEEGRQACINDAFQFCQDVFPDHERVFRCLEARKASLSPACRAQMTPATPAVQPATPRQAPPPRSAADQSRFRQDRGADTLHQAGRQAPNSAGSKAAQHRAAINLPAAIQKTFAAPGINRHHA